jgi:adenylate cyclase
LADVFISYARSDEQLAAAIVEALRLEGHVAWRDDQLPAHRSYSEVIEERLRSAAAVVVLWSSEAVKSQWVRAEADAARSEGKLVQASIDNVVPPMPFNQIQCADLKGWAGEAVHPGWRKIAQSIVDLGGEAARPEISTARDGRKSICVLPFANMSGDAEQEYFSDGISEDITTDISKVSSLTVIARNTAFTYKGRSVDIVQVARELGVSHVLEGSVRKAGDRVRITAQLIDGVTGGHVWAERYDRDLVDIFAIQDEISEAIVAALRVKLLPNEKMAIESRGTANVEAYDLYLMARQFWVAGNYGDVRRDRIVVRTAEGAIELDPHYARAWALLAIAQASLRYHHGLVGEDGMAAADKALALDPSIAEAYAVRARNLVEAGDYEGGKAEIARGLALEPDSWDVIREAARLAMVERRIPDALALYLHATKIDPNDFHSAMMLVTCYLDAGDEAGLKFAASMMHERAERAVQADPLNASAIGAVANALVFLGRIDEAKEKQRRAMLIDPENVSMPYNFACVLANALNEPEAALDLIEPLFARVSPTLLRTALADPDMDPLRESPRFIKASRDAIRRTGLKVDQLPENCRHLAADQQ